MVMDSEELNGPFWPMQPSVGSWGSTVKLASNFFQIACDPKENLFAYSLNFEPHFGAFGMKAQKEIENKINDLFTQFTPFFRKGSRLYSRQKLETVIRTIEVFNEGEVVAVTVTISPIESLSPMEPNNRQSSVLFEYILSKLAGYKHHQKLGHLFFSKSGREDEKMQVIGGFTSSAGHMAGIGHFLTVDSLFRAVHRRNVLESMAANIDSLMAESPSFSPTVDDIQSEWKRRCENAVIIAYNNGRVYRVKRVRFDLNPTCLFSMKKKNTGGSSPEISYVDFYRRFYNRIVYDYNQPLLEVEAEKRSETVLLVPELCALTGLTEEMRKDRMLMHEVLQYSRIGTGDKLNQCVAICRELFSGGSTNARVIDTESYSGKARQLMKDWKCSLSHVPARVEARVLNPCEVSFGSKRYMVEDGNFQRWTRNGSQCPVQLTRWIVLHTEQDRQLVDMWLRSMRELGGGGFGMHFGDPMRLIMSGNPDELRSLLLDNITADIQLVMMFTPQKDSRKVYQILKQITTTVRPCISQVVKSETMRKRQSVVAIVTRVVMQISAKMLGPLWHVNLDPITTPMMAEPTMIVGIDTFENKEHPRKSVIGFVASTDAFISQYYSTTVLIDDLVASSRDDRNEKRYYELVAQKIRLCMHEAFEAFADANDGILPTNIIVYRNSVAKSEMKKIGQNEIEAILDSVKATNSETWDQNSATAAPVIDELAAAAAALSRTKECAYDPSVTYIMCMNNVPARFFMMGSPEGPKNPPPGTVLDPVAPGSDYYSFYLVNQHVSRGSATPTHYIVGYDSSPFNVDAIQNLTFRLSHMYYNFPGGVRLPAPAQYAKKLANMVATSVQADVHPRLRETLYYL